ncbi:alpha-ketoglutarate-dependent dioxygenase alkB homolog 7, mitochondrial-like [Pollicipes pollicipes]|uniref:alpha-ketoglutarate-dependent dioxygenase alkB homolog 7, mitochondrial-like n=1 Tax=Pollicipes pollicipes TaxID=41117 RepID=UPI001884DB7C|nr:alpha-ketoglutarate-dependent dioxygenase alkB homolog 7, mitochondrial-like [Pollicipes pollicipes]XP_037086368.1 alpha-ketoglutarate-dependent dioxygenase alkB homolog 7, mitochondrial-like [Pollicipes pollicipes]XP_037086369.1 alpha-ketoglutarate-dependent dioxygenase alkB homolog 7, mitochondrial-like [Pollicipes pollicipes]XP_037086370.1 alpha-ketoglutarate-dependent dioxygenase alkB homolog 7, mitochondrial-like [Pollicipes pollicipes]
MVPYCLLHWKRCVLTSFNGRQRLGKRLFNSVKQGNEQVARSSKVQCSNALHHEKSYQADQGSLVLHGNWSKETRATVLQDMLVFNDFITESEEECIMGEIGPYLKRMRYEFDHWDDAIHGFRETERPQWNPENARVLDRVRRLAFPVGTAQLRHVHVLDLAGDGVIKPHVDSRRFCGSVIAGLSLLSDAVMRLVSCAEPERRLDALLGRRSLYVMRNSARYDYTHEILSASLSTFAERRVPRGRRVSVICRNEPTAADDDGDGPAPGGPAAS